MNAIVYSRIQHAAHYSFGAPALGHDLEQWDVTGELPRGKRTGNPIVPEGVPNDAEYHCGYLRDGVQHWLFVRTAPLTGTCPRCRWDADRESHEQWANRTAWGTK